MEAAPKKERLFTFASAGWVLLLAFLFTAVGTVCNLAPLFDPCAWIDELVCLRARRSGVPDAWPAGLFDTARALEAGRFGAGSGR